MVSSDILHYPLLTDTDCMRLTQQTKLPNASRCYRTCMWGCVRSAACAALPRVAVTLQPLCLDGKMSILANLPNKVCSGSARTAVQDCSQSKTKYPAVKGVKRSLENDQAYDGIHLRL